MTERKRSVQKQPVCTWIEVHKFVVRDQNHPQIIEIHVGLERDYQGWCMMQGMCQKCHEIVLHGVEQEEEKVFHWS
jgi:ferredoxin